jgi:hypothetical protein
MPEISNKRTSVIYRPLFHQQKNLNMDEKGKTYRTQGGLTTINTTF